MSGKVGVIMGISEEEGGRVLVGTTVIVAWATSGVNAIFAACVVQLDNNIRNAKQITSCICDLLHILNPSFKKCSSDKSLESAGIMDWIIN
jgi:hypothetical protein